MFRGEQTCKLEVRIVRAQLPAYVALLMLSTLRLLSWVDGTMTRSDACPMKLFTLQAFPKVTMHALHHEGFAICLQCHGTKMTEVLYTFVIVCK